MTGCVQKNKSGGYWLVTRDGAAAAAPIGTSGSATTTAGAASTAGDKTASGAPGHRFWNLENASDIEKYSESDSPSDRTGQGLKER